MKNMWGFREFFNRCNILINSFIAPVWLRVIRYTIRNYDLYRYHVTGMAGRYQNWTSGQVLHRSQSLCNLTPGEEGEPDTRLQLPQVNSRSHANIRTSSEEEGLELLGSATDIAISNFEEVDTSLLDYDSDTPEVLQCKRRLQWTLTWGNAKIPLRWTRHISHVELLASQVIKTC
jgi:hypothetical protein